MWEDRPIGCVYSYLNANLAFVDLWKSISLEVWNNTMVNWQWLLGVQKSYNTDISDTSLSDIMNIDRVNLYFYWVPLYCVYQEMHY